MALSFTAREANRMRVFESRMPKKILGPQVTIKLPL
jgi:hypothetical protein